MNPIPLRLKELTVGEQRAAWVQKRSSLSQSGTFDFEAGAMTSNPGRHRRSQPTDGLKQQVEKTTRGEPVSSQF